MAIESKNLLVWVKAMSRGQALPLDASEIHDSLAAAKSYMESAIAYPGQTIKALMDDGKYHEYIIQPSDAGYTLEEVGAVSESDLKQYVMVVDELPGSGQEQGILYICGTTGSIWDGSAWVEVFHDVQPDIDQMSEAIDAVESALATKAPIENPVFSGVVKVGEDEVALKSYVEQLFAQLGETVTTPDIADVENGVPAEGYKAGQMWRVAEAGEYVGETCEVGDLIICLKDYAEETASEADFMVVQANIDGAVTSAAETTTVGEIVVFNSVTGKAIGSSGVAIGSLNDAIAKAHEHANKEVLDSYDKTQEQLLAAASETAQGLVDAAKTSLQSAIDGKADKATTLEGYGITDAYNKTELDAKLDVITENLNTKITAADVDTKISEANEEVLASAASDAAEKLAARIGDIPSETTVKSYIDTAVGSGGTASAEAIATAKQEAITASKTYTDTQLQIKEF